MNHSAKNLAALAPGRGTPCREREAKYTHAGALVLSRIRRHRERRPRLLLGIVCLLQSLFPTSPVRDDESCLHPLLSSISTFPGGESAQLQLQLYTGNDPSIPHLAPARQSYIGHLLLPPWQHNLNMDSLNILPSLQNVVLSPSAPPPSSLSHRPVT